MILEQPKNMLPDLADPKLIGAWLNRRTTGGEDYGPLGHDGTVNGTIQFEEVGMYSLGDLDYLNAGDITEVEGIGAFTATIWVRNTKDIIGGTGLEIMMSKSDGGPDTFRLFWGQDENIYFSVDTVNGDATAIFTDGITTGKAWHRVTGVYNGTDVRVYVDAVLGDTVAALTGVTVNSAHPVTIGDDFSGGATTGWQGWLKNAELYSEAKSADWESFQFQQAVPDDSLVLAVPGDGLDKSRQKQVLTLNGSIVVGDKIECDGAGSISIGTSIVFSGSDAWTVAFWGDRTGADDDGMVIGKYNTTDDFIWLATSNYFRFRSTDTVTQDFALTDFSILSRYVLTGDNGTLTLYKNGVLVNSYSTSTAFEIDNIGEAYRVGDFRYTGTLDDIEIFTDEAKSVGWAKNDYEQSKGNY